MVQIPSCIICIQLHSFHLTTPRKGRAEDLEERERSSHPPRLLSTAMVCPCNGMGHPEEGLLRKGAVSLAGEKLSWLFTWAIVGKAQLEKNG